jgi:hypothetical protein
MAVRSRQPLSSAAPWVTVLLGLAVLLDVLWLASRMTPDHATELVAVRPAAVAADRNGPPSLHMHPVY